MVVQIGLCSVAKHMDNQLETILKGKDMASPIDNFAKKARSSSMRMERLRPELRFVRVAAFTLNTFANFAFRWRKSKSS